MQGPTHYNPQDGTYCVDLDSNGTTPGAYVEQSFATTVGQQYRVQYKDALIQADWFDLFPEVLAIGPAATCTNVGNLPHRFYRVLVVP